MPALMRLSGLPKTAPTTTSEKPSPSTSPALATEMPKRSYAASPVSTTAATPARPVGPPWKTLAVPASTRPLGSAV